VTVSYNFCVLSGRVLYDKPITRTEESYRLCCVIVCDLETSRMRQSWPALDCFTKGKSLVLSLKNVDCRGIGCFIRHKTKHLKHFLFSKISILVHKIHKKTGISEITSFQLGGNFQKILFIQMRTTITPLTKMQGRLFCQTLEEKVL
jgi:hypothetical protein